LRLTPVRRFGIHEAAAAGLGFVVLASVGVADGGVFPRTWRLATLALAALAAAALLSRDRIRISRLEWGVLASVAALAAWTALSAAWSTRPTASLLQGERVVLYAVAILVVLLVVERAVVPHLLAGIVAGISAVCAYGLLEFVFRRPALDPFEGRLLHRPLGYANALGIFAAIGILVALGLALSARRSSVRVVTLSPLVVLGPTLYFTSSRGAWLALGVGVAFLAALDGRVRVRTVAVISAATAAALVLAVIAFGSLGGVAGDNRADYWSVAWDVFVDHPILGAGAATYGDYWLALGPGGSFTRTAHSLYLQSLAELGLVGLLLVAAMLTLPLLRLREGASPLAAAAGAGYVAYLFHTGIDWDWEMPATTLAGLFCGGALLAARRPETVAPLRWWARVLLLVPIAALALIAWLRLDDGPRTPFGLELVRFLT